MNVRCSRPLLNHEVGDESLDGSEDHALGGSLWPLPHVGEAKASTFSRTHRRGRPVALEHVFARPSEVILAQLFGCGTPVSSCGTGRLHLLKERVERGESGTFPLLQFVAAKGEGGSGFLEHVGQLLNRSGQSADLIRVAGRGFARGLRSRLRVGHWGSRPSSHQDPDRNSREQQGQASDHHRSRSARRRGRRRHGISLGRRFAELWVIDP